MINYALLKNLKPCKGRWKNYLKHYKAFEGSLRDFFELDQLSYVDKLWVAFRVLNLSQMRRSAAFIAKSVLPIFEDKYPDDLRPRRAIEAVLNGDNSTAAYTAADAATPTAYAAYAAYTAAAAAAAYNAAYAAAAAAAAYNAAYAAAAAYNAAYAAAAYAAAAYGDDADARSKQESLNLQIILDVYEGKK
jgi:hypothetical protein